MEHTRPRVGYPRQQSVEPADGCVYLVLVFSIVIAVPVAANGISLLTQTAYPAPEGASVYTKKPFQLSAVYGFRAACVVSPDTFS